MFRFPKRFLGLGGSEKFPEAFERFENDVDVDRFNSYHELTLAFRWWAGQKWKGTSRQWAALNDEAERLGFRVPEFIHRELREGRASDYYVSEGQRKTATWKHEVIKVKGISQSRYRDVQTGRFIRKP